jgi:hypothetical protein
MISKTFVKALCLIDGENPTIGYLYEAIDRAKEAIKYFYEGRYPRDNGLEKQLMLSERIEHQWNGKLHCPMHATKLLNPSFSYPCSFDFEGEFMEGFHKCL